MAPALLRKLFEKSPQCADHEKLLTSSQSPKTLRKPVPGVSETDTYGKRSRTENDDRNTYDIMTSSIQICPHESLSFERMKRIVRLPNFKYSGDEICAFTNASGHYHVSSEKEMYQCRPCPEVLKSLQANAFYKYQWSRDFRFEGLVLCLDWTMRFDDHMDVTGSVWDLQSFLDTLGIDICQHMRMSDARIASKLYRLCNPDHPDHPVGDPVEAYKKEKLHRRIAYKCAGCNTTYETWKDEESCHVLIKRYLGKGKCAYQWGWLDQCGERAHTLWSFMKGIRHSVAILQ